MITPHEWECIVALMDLTRRGWAIEKVGAQFQAYKAIPDAFAADGSPILQAFVREDGYALHKAVAGWEYDREVVRLQLRIKERAEKGTAEKDTTL